MWGSGLLVACKFGCEDAAVREVQRALGELHGTNKIPLSTSAATLEDGNASDRSDDTAAKGEGRSMSIKEHARRIAVAHKGLAWLRYDGTSQKHSPRDDETVDEGFPGKMANTRADAVEAFAALVGRRDVPAAALKSCQYIFPVSSCVAATEEALEAAVAEAVCPPCTWHWIASHRGGATTDRHSPLACCSHLVRCARSRW